MEELKLRWVTGTIPSLLFALLAFPQLRHAWGGIRSWLSTVRCCVAAHLIKRSISQFIRQPVSFSKRLLQSALPAAVLLAALQGLFRAVFPKGELPCSAVVRVLVLAAVLLDAVLLHWFSAPSLFHPAPAPSSVKLQS